LSEALERYRWFIVALFAVPLLSGVVYLIQDRVDDNGALEVRDGDASVADIRIDISGGVKNPGVYSVPDGSRWLDAIAAAGGATDDADLAAINLARRVQDEDKIVVPLLGGGPAVAGASQAPLVNINTATQSELEELPGIGEVRASDIIRSRETAGPFAAIDDLLTREVIPESVYEDIADLITTGP
jgi:competence protein ComEA